jgi:predicted membrane protein
VPDVYDDEVETQRILTVFSSNTRSGYWEPPERLEVLALFGGAKLDFRDANLYSGVTVVYCLALFGGVDIIVPEELEVDANGTGLFGGFEHKPLKERKRRLFRRGEPETEERKLDEEPPVLMIRGLALFGGVTIRVR